MTDTERLVKLQQDVLSTTKAAIMVNAPGIPVHLLAAYIKQIGGSVMAVDDNMDITKFSDPSPFRLCITTKERPDFERARQIVIVDKVKGWG